VLFLGVAYKPNINDERESPTLEIMDITQHKGGEVSYHDPFIPEITTSEGNKLYSVELTAKTLTEADCVVLTTNHDAFDISFIRQHAKIIVDLRNMVEQESENVYKL
jgi:UDP-N-acetyl-D-glucosamine dehydrogenase